MSKQPPSTPVKVPASAANHTAATLDPDLRSQINTVLLRDGHITKIQEALLHALNSHPTNWPTLIQTHALSLLRSGEVTTFPALLKRVLDDVRHDSALATTTTTTAATANGKPTTNGVNGAAAAEKTSLAIPESVVEEALRVTRESLEAVCELDETAP